jgi:hypothetical protein
MAIISNLKSPFDIFVSILSSNKDALRVNYNMPSFEIFCEQLTSKHVKLLHINVLDIGSKHKTLFIHKNKGTKASKKQSKIPTPPKTTKSPTTTPPPP